MRALVLFAALLALAACTKATASRIDERTFKIEGPGIPGGSDAPNRRLAAQLCPGGYRVLDSATRIGTPDGYLQEPGDYTNWTIRCL
jgi:hypothetical protein